MRRTNVDGVVNVVVIVASDRRSAKITQGENCMVLSDARDPTDTRLRSNAACSICLRRGIVVVRGGALYALAVAFRCLFLLWIVENGS